MTRTSSLCLLDTLCDLAFPGRRMLGRCRVLISIARKECGSQITGGANSPNHPRQTSIRAAGTNRRTRERCDWPHPHSSCGLLLNNALEWCISNSFPWVVRCVTRPSIPVSRSIAVFLPACPAQILRQGCLALARCRHDDRSQRKTSLASD